MWISSVHEFAKQLTKKYSPDRRKELGLDSSPIKVAVIDDGVDLNKVNPTGWDGWMPSEVPGTSVHNPWYFTDRGHGTEMVRLIQKVCPFAHFFIGKLDTRGVVYKSVAESAVEVCFLDICT